MKALNISFAVAVAIGAVFLLVRHSDATEPGFVPRSAVAAASPEPGEHPIYVRTPGRGAQEIGELVIASLRKSQGLEGEYEVEQKPGLVWFSGSDWSLRVSDQGNNVRFRRDTPSSAPAQAKPTAADVQAAGLAVVRNVLGEIVKLGDGEKLVSTGPQYEYTAGQAADALTPDEPVVTGWAAVFGRSVNGSLVVGGGSHAAVIFDAAGVLEAFDVDWPVYEKTDKVTTNVSLTTIRDRAKEMEPPLGDSELRTEKAIDCGYLDPGGRSRRSRVKLVQPGCVRLWISETTGLAPGNHEMSAFSQFVLSADAPLDDPYWTSDADCGNPQGCEPEDN